LTKFIKITNIWKLLCSYKFIKCLIVIDKVWQFNARILLSILYRTKKSKKYIKCIYLKDIWRFLTKFNISTHNDFSYFSELKNVIREDLKLLQFYFLKNIVVFYTRNDTLYMNRWILCSIPICSLYLFYYRISFKINVYNQQYQYLYIFYKIILAKYGWQTVSAHNLSYAMIYN